MTRICAITGTTGNVGPCVASKLADAGWEVRALGRKPSAQKPRGFSEAHLALGEPVAPQALAGADALVHMAYDYSWTRWADIERVNVQGTRRLLAAAREAGIDRIVYMSTIAAFPGARSLYAHAKLACEQSALEAGAAVIRPGRIWGQQGTSSLGILQSAAERLPVVPLPVPGTFDLFFTHEQDLAALVAALLDRWPAGSGKLYVAAAEDSIEFAELLRRLALKAGRRPRLIQLPWRSVRQGLKLLEGLGLHPPFGSDGILTLAESDSHPFARATDSTGRYGVSFRPYPIP